MQPNRHHSLFFCREWFILIAARGQIASNRGDHMIIRTMTAAVCLFGLAGCTTDKLQTALSTPKNPPSVFSRPQPPKGRAPTQQDFIEPLYRVLLESSDVRNNERTMRNVSNDNMRRYLGAGFALSDIYCAGFFTKTDEAYRRRRFGRTLTNDVGTAMTTVLGLAKAGEGIVTGVAAAVGLADSAWRNYDDSFVVSPDLSNVQSLVFAAQDNFRARTLAPRAALPADYGTAQSVILRYSNLCSFLGMKALLDQSAGDQRKKLIDDTQSLSEGGVSDGTITVKEPVATGKGAIGEAEVSVSSPPVAPDARPVTATPALPANKAAEGS